MNTNELLHKPVPQLLKQIAFPASIGIMFNTFYNVIDTFYAGLISTNALAGLSISFLLYFMIIGVGFGFNSALTALIGNALGKHKRTLASVYAHKGLVFVALLGVLVASLGYAFDKELLVLVGAKKEFLGYALEYIDIILLAAPFFLLNAGLNAVLIALGDTKTYRNVLIIGFFANIILDPLFIYGIAGYLKMGIGGIAFSTALIQIIACVYLVLKVLKTKLISLDKLGMYAPKLSIYRHIFNQGTPPALNMLTMSLGSVIIIYFVSSYGTLAVASFGAAFRVEQILLLPAIGLNSAVLSIVSNNFGAKQYDRIYETIKLSLFVGFCLWMLGIVLNFLFGERLIGLFTSDEQVIKLGLDYLNIAIFNLMGYVTLFVCVSILQGIKKPKMIFYVGLYRQILAIIPIFWLISTYFKFPYHYLWFGLAFVIYSAAIFIAWHTKSMLKLTCKS